MPEMSNVYTPKFKGDKNKIKESLNDLIDELTE